MFEAEGNKPKSSARLGRWNSRTWMKLQRVQGASARYQAETLHMAAPQATRQGLHSNQTQQ